jgi:hypothetical protein
MALRALARDYDQINYDLFGNALRRPALRLADADGQLGLWDPDPPTIALSRQLIAERPWGVVLEVLKHEMAHQFVCVVLQETEAPHGPLFRKTCHERGIDSAAAGAFNLESAADSGLMHKVTRLLALAESGNKHEAEAAMSAAQRLMLKHNLAPRTGHQRNYRIAHLGAPSGRVAESQRVLATLLSEYFFVEILWVDVWRALEGKRGYILEICGEPENVEMAEYVFSFLNQSADRLWREHKRSKAIAGNKDRRRFAAGVMTGFYRKLQSEHERNHAEGLIWLGDPELSGYFKRRYPRTRSVAYLTSSSSDAHAEGRAAGAALVLHKGVTAGSSPGKPRLLRG